MQSMQDVAKQDESQPTNAYDSNDDDEHVPSRPPPNFNVGDGSSDGVLRLPATLIFGGWVAATAPRSYLGKVGA